MGALNDALVIERPWLTPGETFCRVWHRNEPSITSGFQLCQVGISQEP